MCNPSSNFLGNLEICFTVDGKDAPHSGASQEGEERGITRRWCWWPQMSTFRVLLQGQVNTLPDKVNVQQITGRAWHLQRFRFWVADSIPASADVGAFQPHPQILMPRLEHVRAGGDGQAQLFLALTHTLGVMSPGAASVPSTTTPQSQRLRLPNALLPGFTKWRASCYVSFLPKFGIMAQTIKKLTYLFESICYGKYTYVFSSAQFLPLKYWLIYEDGNKRRIYFHNNNWTKHFCLKISTSKKKKKLIGRITTSLSTKCISFLKYTFNLI